MSRSEAVEAAKQLMTDPAVGWSVGIEGAIAEFYRRPDEDALLDDRGICTQRGSFGLKVGPCSIFAGEALGHDLGGWTQWISFCLPATEAAMAGRHAVTELGPDLAASEASSRDAILFDLGIGGSYFQLCVRVAEGDAAALLRKASGKALLEDQATVHALVSMSPDRVFESKLARIEVRQAIADPTGISPEGPHTHLLPHLLRADMGHDRYAPDGWIAQAVAYPPHPLRDAFGHPKAFDRSQFEAFQRWLQRFGDARHLSLKRSILDAIGAGVQPETMAASIEQERRDSVRLVLQQARWLEHDPELLKRWADAFGA